MVMMKKEVNKIVKSQIYELNTLTFKLLFILFYFFLLNVVSGYNQELVYVFKHRLPHQKAFKD